MLEIFSRGIVDFNFFIPKMRFISLLIVVALFNSATSHQHFKRSLLTEALIDTEEELENEICNYQPESETLHLITLSKYSEHSLRFAQTYLSKHPLLKSNQTLLTEQIKLLKNITNFKKFLTIVRNPSNSMEESYSIGIREEACIAVSALFQLQTDCASINDIPEQDRPHMTIAMPRMYRGRFGIWRSEGEMFDMAIAKTKLFLGASGTLILFLIVVKLTSAFGCFLNEFQY